MKNKLNGTYGMVLGIIYLAGLGAAVGAPNVARRSAPRFIECVQTQGSYRVWIDRKGDGLEANLLRRVPGGLGTLELSQGTFHVEAGEVASRHSASLSTSQAPSQAATAAAAGTRYHDALGRFELETLPEASSGTGAREVPARLFSPATGGAPLEMTCLFKSSG